MGDAKKIMEFNILILGETGVGKSTFINAFVNYLLFKTLDDAIIAEQLMSLIPSHFSVTDENFQIRDIVFGNDGNEETRAGASSTQEARSYKFPVGNAVIRLIDTPGIGDTRGAHVDEENFKNVLSLLSQLSELHGICILLKPTHARLTVSFQYCLKQLFSCLHKNACDNINFIFTNTRSMLYSVGDTLPTIKEVFRQISSVSPHAEIPFNEHNVFCVDNEAFRFLLAKRQGVNFSEGDKNDFKLSWEKSEEVYERLIEHVIKSKPHNIQDTISLNNIRRIIKLLSELLGELTENIRSCDDKISVLIKECEESSQRRNDYIEQMSHSSICVTKIPGTPQLVCEDKNCAETYQVHGVQQKHYKTVCHVSSFLNNIEQNILGCPQLKVCPVMINEFCTFCGHHFLTHVCVSYKTSLGASNTLDSTIQSKVAQEEAKEAEIKERIRQLKLNVGKYGDEKKVIDGEIFKIASSLVDNAIILYNDKYTEFIKYLIDNEKNLRSTPNKTLISVYQKHIGAYDEQVEVFKKIIKSLEQGGSHQNSSAAIPDVDNLITELSRLEILNHVIESFQRDRNTGNIKLSNVEQEYNPSNYTTSNIGIFGKLSRWFGRRVRQTRTTLVEKI